ncbi:hypothetical protein KC19_11G120500 [Ceratodon purpureus]|uniref:Thioredoxin-like fold domain-containing protein n=1 Tax=Ceratodon purpureus TaxID=3225 RepID=A0A8T0GFK8_CERPU|nr:hypothetical protein KC19_11G120500 [Ceratodon purpureus]
MEEPSAKIDTLLNHLKEFSRYYTGYPRKEQVSRVMEFTSERQFVELLHQGEPVAVAFTLRCPWTRRFDRVLEDAAAEWYPHIKFVRVECPKYPGFCIARQRKDYPFVEIFHSPKPVWTLFLPLVMLSIRGLQCEQISHAFIGIADSWIWTRTIEENFYNLKTK